jgi:hypothetical protein
MTYEADVRDAPPEPWGVQVTGPPVPTIRSSPVCNGKGAPSFHAETLAVAPDGIVTCKAGDDVAASMTTQLKVAVAVSSDGFVVTRMVAVATANVELAPPRVSTTFGGTGNSSDDETEMVRFPPPMGEARE